MARPQKQRCVKCEPKVACFKPRGIPMSDLEQVRLSVDQLVAFRLTDLMGLSGHEVGQEMGVARATFGRICQQARKTVPDARYGPERIRSRT